MSNLEQDTYTFLVKHLPGKTTIQQLNALQSMVVHLVSQYLSTGELPQSKACYHGHACKVCYDDGY